MNNKSWSASILCISSVPFPGIYVCVWGLGFLLQLWYSRGTRSCQLLWVCIGMGCPLQYVYCGNSYCRNNKKAIQLCNLAFLRFHGCYATKHWWVTCPLGNPNDSLNLKWVNGNYICKSCSLTDWQWSLMFFLVSICMVAHYCISPSGHTRDSNIVHPVYCIEAQLWSHLSKVQNNKVLVNLAMTNCFI